MATTSPDGIVSPDSDQPVNWVGDWSATASSIQTALSNRSTRRGTSSQRTAATGVREGTLWGDTTTNSLWLFTSGMWVEVTPSSTGVITGSGVIETISPGVTIANSRFLKIGNLALIQITATGTFGSPNSNVGVLSPSWRPVTAATGPVFFSASGFQQGVVRVSSTGGIALWKESSGNRGQAEFTVSYPVL